MDLKLANKTALITGASRGLGFAVARQLALEGAFVALNSRGEVGVTEAANKIATETGTKAIGFAGDVASPDFPDKLAVDVANHFGGIDILIANAGGPPSGPFESFSDETWQKAIEMSFMSQVRLIRASLPYLRKSICASVLTITSYSVKQPVPNLVLSNSIRAATVGLTKSLALELGNQGIRFNSILPGWTETERVTELMSYRAKANGTSIEEEISKQAKDSPLGRLCTPEEFANAAVFLVSPAAAYVTGVMLTVDGGMYKGTL